jgi:tetratricopeptide (TPR) repeat protein
MKTDYPNSDKDKKKLVPWLDKTRLLEKEDKEQAIKEYKKIASTYPLNEEVYNRLMILFRQLKMDKEELFWIDKAIKVFEKSFEKPSFHPSSKIASLSKSLLRSTGLIDKKGESFYQPEPIGKWQKRKELLIKKMRH